MRMIVDSNCLRDENFELFLQARTTNIAVLSDQVTFEIHKNRDLESVHQSLDILSRYPKQVQVMKSFGAVCKQRGRSKGLTRRLICQKSTRWFGESCKDLAKAREGNRSIARLFEWRGHKAADHMDKLLDGVAAILNEASQFKKLFSESELKIIRSDKEFTEQINRKLIAATDEIYLQLIGDNELSISQPTLEELPNTFLYRLSLALMLNYLRWEESGGPHLKLNPEKVRNDIVDLKIATYATYFDGVLSYDKRLVSLYEKLNFVIAVLIHNIRTS